MELRTLLLEHRVELRPRIRCRIDLLRAALIPRCEILAEIRAILLDDALRLRLAALIIVRGIVKRAVEAGVQRTIASLATVAKPNSFLPLDLDRPPAMKAIHHYV